MSYLPTRVITPSGVRTILSTITVDMARFPGPVRARWYDPANGTYSTVEHSPFRNSGSVHLTTPGKNADGDNDWLLVLTTR